MICPHKLASFKAVFSLALLSAMMVCISVSGSVQKPEGTNWDKKVVGSDWRKWKVCIRPKKVSHWEYLLTNSSSS